MGREARDDALHGSRTHPLRDTGASVKLIWEAVDILASAGGGSFARRNNVLNRIWQDVRITAMHGMTVPTTNTELYGRLLCGMDSFGMKV